MKIIVTGSLGHISKPLTEELIQKGHTVTVISSRAAQQAAIESLGAIAAIGSVTDPAFLAQVFQGADAVYCMIPPSNYFDHNLDLPGYTRQVALNYAGAIKASGVKRVVLLSSIGAHLDQGNGIIRVYHEVEAIIREAATAAVSIMRPTSFYYNLLAYIPAIRNAGIIAVNYGGDKVIWVSPKDIALAVSEELESQAPGTTVRYVASDERTGAETAAVLGAAIGNPGLQWVVVPDEQVQQGLEGIGMQPAIARGLVEMYAAVRDGKFWEDYYLHPPAALGQVKLEDFARDFAAAYERGDSTGH